MLEGYLDSRIIFLPCPCLVDHIITGLLKFSFVVFRFPERLRALLSEPQHLLETCFLQLRGCSGQCDRMTVVRLQEQDFTLGKLSDCFGKDGNFTIVVEEQFKDATSNPELPETASEEKDPQRDSSAQASEFSLKRTEFKVWASLLSLWSPVSQKMIAADNFVEKHKGEVIIRDFSASGVEMFLRFLYTGVVEASLSMLVELAALADKYQVKKLYSLCLVAVWAGLTPEPARSSQPRISFKRPPCAQRPWRRSGSIQPRR